MSKALLFSIAVAVCLAVAPSTFALNQDYGDTSSMSACGSVDECFSVGDWWSVAWDQYGVATACSLGLGCQLCVDNGFGKAVCAYHVPMDAFCACKNVPRAGAGPGITDCTPDGGCIYRH